MGGGGGGGGGSQLGLEGLIWELGFKADWSWEGCWDQESWACGWKGSQVLWSEGLGTGFVGTGNECRNCGWS